MNPTRRALACLLAAGVQCKEAPQQQVIQPFPERYAGVGLELRIEERLPVVVRTIPGGSAAAQGVAVGDAIVEIEGVSVRGWALPDAVNALRGPEGTRIFVTLRRRTGGPKEVLGLWRGSLRRAPQPDGAIDARSYRPTRE